MPTATSTEAVTYCRICEPLCGLIATVDHGRLVSLRPDADHPLSKGTACPKGIAFTEIQNDPDRVLHPLRRTAEGEFEQVSWDEALTDIAARLKQAWDEDGGSAVGHYLGNPSAFSYSAALWSGLFLKRLGSVHQYTTGSQDINSRFVASKLLYGAATQMPFPDLPRTDFVLMLGANPHVSHGSAVRAPRIKHELSAITARGGRVVVVDPRRTETAKAHEHVRVRPDSDAWLLLSLLHVVFTEGLTDEAAIAAQSTGVDLLRDAALGFPPEETAARTGVDADVVRQLARDFATAPRATAYGRTGACLGRHGTLVSFLIDVLSLVTGNLDRPGGTVFSQGVIPLEELAEKAGAMTYGASHSRVGGFPDVMGIFPSGIMAEEITRTGHGRLRALIVTAGNPVLTVPDGERLVAALQELDLLVSFDLYVNETNRYADYVLPAVTFLEREDFPFALTAASPRPFFQATEAVLEPYGEARPEWEVFEELAHRMGLSLTAGGPLSALNRPLLALERRGLRLTPRRLMTMLLRTGPYGDRFGLRRGGLNAKTARKHPHGVVLGEHAATGILADVVRLPGGKVCLDPPEIAEELARLGNRHRTDGADGSDPDFPILLIGLREIRSQNSWMHNSPTLMKGARRQSARIHPEDAAAAGVVDGGAVRIVSRHGAIEVAVTVTDDVGPGTVAVPHGWGHRGGWQLANASEGTNVNQLMSSDTADLEVLAGMTLLNGVAVRLEACP
ncbi:MAG: molybdopterin-dependent oxidoreductase [Propionibacteriales bacterium]|nr:molybdopterin-dependent oxidoreductase [Propionibacteriales bacterium]